MNSWRAIKIFDREMSMRDFTVQIRRDQRVLCSASRLTAALFPTSRARSAAQKARSSRAAIQMAAPAASFRLRLGGGVVLRFRSRRLSTCASLPPLSDRRPKPLKKDLTGL
jgi:hypothetical protein